MNLKEKLDALQKKSQSFEGMIEAGTLLSAEQMAEFDTVVNEIESVNKQLEVAERSAKARASANAPANALPLPTATSPQAERKTLILRSAAGANVDHWEGFTREEKATNAYGFGMWCLSLMGEDKLGSLATKASEYCKSIGVLKAHFERDNESGGFFVPDQFVNTIIDLRNQYGQFRQFAQVLPMSSDVATISRRSTGLSALWVGESASISESTMAWDQVRLVAKKLASYAILSSELSEDSVIDLANYLAQEMAYQMAYQEDLAGFTGDGTSTFGGIIGATAKLKGLSATIANIAGLRVGTGNAYSELTLADFRSVIGRCPSYARRNAAWFVHPVLYFETMVGLAESAGGTTTTELINGTRRDMFMGYPVNLIEVMPSVEANSQVCALFGDLRSAAILGNRRGITVSRSEHVRFVNDDLVLKATARLDINVHSTGNASATASLRVPGPLVGLITAAA